METLLDIFFQLQSTKLEQKSNMKSHALTCAKALSAKNINYTKLTCLGHSQRVKVVIKLVVTKTLEISLGHKPECSCCSSTQNYTQHTLIIFPTLN